MTAHAITPHPHEHARRPVAGRPADDSKYLYYRSVRISTARRIPASALAEFVAALELQALEETREAVR